MKRIVLVAPLILSALFPCLPVQAVLPPSLYREARQIADHHVQVEVTKIDVPRMTPGECAITGKVVTVFRTAGGLLAPGAEVRFDVSCARRDDDIPVGGTLWQNVWHLERAKFYETYLMGETLPDMWIPRWQSMAIPEPRPQPYCPVDGPGLTCD